PRGALSGLPRPPRPTPATSGTWSTSRTGRSASRCSAGCRRGPTRTAGSPRWRTTARTSGAGCCPGSRPGRPMTDRYDAVVVGLCALGSSAAVHLARGGQRVLGLERFELGHKRGASHDTSRILRHSYHPPGYVRLTQEAYADWADLERWSSEQLVTVVGGLDLFPADPAIPMDDYTDSLTEVGIPYELLDVTEIGRRWPQFS